MTRCLRGLARVLGACLAAAGVVGLVQACTNTDVTSVTIASVTVSPASATLVVGESRQFSADVRDVDGAIIPSSLVTWSSADESVASVGSDGQAAALHPGSAQIRATVQGVTGNASLTVESGPTIVSDMQSVSLFAPHLGANPDAVDVSVVNGGSGGLSGLSAVTSYAGGETSGWLSVALSSTAAPATLTLSATTGSLAVGTYHATVTLRSSVAADLDVRVDFSITENRPILHLSPTAVGFAGVAGASPPTPQGVQVTNTGGGALTGLIAIVSYGGTGGWLTADLSSTAAPSVLNLRADPARLQPGSYTATVQVSSPVAVNGARSVSVSFAVDAEPKADLGVVKTGPAQVVQDDSAAFVITVHNDGPRDAVSAIVVDSLPPSLGFARASGGGQHAQRVVTWPGRIIASGATVADTVWVVASTVGTALNVARVSSVTTDSSPGNNRGEVATQVVTKPADLGVAKIGPSAATAGTQITYLIDVAHVDGPVAAQGVEVTDVLTPDLVFVSANASGSYDAAKRTVTWTLADIPPAGRAGVSLTVQIASTVTGTITNTASVSTVTRDPNATNDVATAVTTVGGMADLALTKTGPATATAGSRITYTIRADHVGGPSAASGVEVRDVLPTTLSFVSATGGGVYDATERSVTWSLPSVAVGGSASLDLTVDVGPTVSGSVSNTATVHTSSVDPVSGNDASTAVTAVSRVADVSVTKTGPATADAGKQVTYAIAVGNAVGPSSASGVVVKDVLPADLGFESATSGGTWDGATRTVTWVVDDVAVGSSVSLGVTANVAPTAGSTVVNTASVTSTSSDTIHGNDASSVSTTIHQLADLKLTKTAPATAVAGTQITYEITAMHVGGTTAATGVVVTDPLPAGVTFVSASDGGTASGGTVTWNVGGIPIGGSANVTVTVAIGSGTSGPVTNTATVTATTSDPTPGDNIASASTTVSRVADVGVTKTGPATADAGKQITYAIAVGNAVGPSRAGGVVVKDVLPAELGFASATSGGTWDGATRTVTWVVGDLAVGSGVSLGVTANVASTASGTVVNTASVTSTSSDTIHGNDASSVSTTIRQLADLKLTKTAPATAVAGTQITYEITAKHVGGTGPATGVVVTDPLPAGVTFVSATGGGTAGGRTVTWNVGGIPIGGSANVTVTVAIGSGTSGPVTNTAAVTATTSDPTPGDNTASASTTVTQVADLTITKSGPATAAQGGDVTYTIAVRNNSTTSGASGVTVRDKLPGSTTFKSASDDGTLSGDTVRWSLGAIAPNTTVSRSLTVTVGLAALGTISNTATVSSTSTDPNPADNASTSTTPVIPAADLSLTMTGPSAQLDGSTFLYTIGVRNNSGTNPAGGIQITDVLPSTLSYVTSTNGGTPSADGHTVTWTIDALSPGTSPPDRTLTVTVGPGVSGNVSNTVTVSSATLDPNAGNNSQTVVTTVTQSADLSMALTGPATASAGSDVTYDINVTNLAPTSGASGVQITYTLPADVTFVSATGGGTPSGGTVRWSLASLAPGTYGVQVTISIGASVNGDVVSGASVTSTSPDPDGSNNAATWATTVSPPPEPVPDAAFQAVSLPPARRGTGSDASLRWPRFGTMEAMDGSRVYPRPTESPPRRDVEPR